MEHTSKIISERTVILGEILDRLRTMTLDELRDVLTYCDREDRLDDR